MHWGVYIAAPPRLTMSNDTRQPATVADNDTVKSECEPCECDDCCVCHGHEWVIEQCNNGVGHSWIEAECRYCDAEITDEEYQAETEPDPDAAYDAMCCDEDWDGGA